MAKLNTETIGRLRQLVIDGERVLQEREDLQRGLDETISAIAKEVEMKPAILKKVIQIAHKRTLGSERDKFNEIEEILNELGKGE
mgnify:CR=1 FL=1